jgi:hypothetical protein
MKIIKTRLLPIGAVLALAGTLLVITPKAAHAVVAALVQVANTTANPAITQDTSKQAAQAVEVFCTDAGNVCYSLLPGGNDSAPNQYSVPANQTLMVTSVDVTMVTTTAKTCEASVTLLTNGISRKAWEVDQIATNHFDYPTGFALAPGALLTMNQTSLTCRAIMTLEGYLTAN